MNQTARGELIGRTLGGRFRLTAFLGEGAMASVYRGEQDDEPRHVAVKVMHAELHEDPTFAKRFTREARAAARIVHRNSVQILGQGADGGLLFLAMELLAGEDLFDLLARERRLPPARAVRIVLQICDALSAAHAQGIIHRDLKPENVMILSDPAEPGADLVKVLDFGIAKILERGAREASEDDEPDARPVDSAPPSSALTRVGTLVGTPEYMSPEQCMGVPVDARSDTYSCGVLLFHIVTGRAPFVGKAPIDIMMQQVDKPPPAPTTLAPGLHPELERVILKALSKAPHARYQTAEELAGELLAILQEIDAKPAGAGPTPPTSNPGNALRGVPGEVKIHAPIAPARGSDPPPATMRSPATASDVAVMPLGSPVPAASGSPAVVSHPVVARPRALEVEDPTVTAKSPGPPRSETAEEPPVPPSPASTPPARAPEPASTGGLAALWQRGQGARLALIAVGVGLLWVLGALVRYLRFR